MTNENETPELLPCPFCGSSEVNPEGWYRMTTRLFGPDCVVLGPACDECGSSAKTIAAWNTRADLADAKDKRIEELEAENRELHMQVLVSDSQAQMAYEEQERLEAKLARVIEVLERIAGRGMK
jgi:hypothetical protein